MSTVLKRNSWHFSRTASPTERFMANMEVPADLDDCWRWLGSMSGGDYGCLSVGGKTVYAHRLSYEIFVGPIPEGLEVDHLCRNRSCINPTHLEPVTRQENIRRSDAHLAIAKTVRALAAAGRHYNQQKARCPQGHPYDERNTLKWGGRRYCRACRRIWAQRRWRRKRVNHG